MSSQNAYLLMSSDQFVIAKKYYAKAKDSFERGQYRQAIEALEAASTLVNRNSTFGGELQLWLTMAYEAAGHRQMARDLCRSIEKHPDPSTRKQATRMLYILEAPRLETRPEWLVQIPDLSNVADSEPQFRRGQSPHSSIRAKKIPAIEAPIELSSAHNRDNQFIWVALGAIVILLLGLSWLA